MAEVDGKGKSKSGFVTTLFGFTTEASGGAASAKGTATPQV
jgi:hypothetical protein